MYWLPIPGLPPDARDARQSAGIAGAMVDMERDGLIFKLGQPGGHERMPVAMETVGNGRFGQRVEMIRAKCACAVESGFGEVCTEKLVAGIGVGKGRGGWGDADEVDPAQDV